MLEFKMESFQTSLFMKKHETRGHEKKKQTPFWIGQSQI